MSLPLLKRARDDAAVFVRVSPKRGGADAYGSRSAHALLPGRALRPGEQYRFHVDMQSCIGCKCCVVACNEQNGNPAAINWRRVVEIEGGWYPQTGRSYLSMGCNHCLEPTCLEGCPVDAYSKDALTGIVRHSADVCIGCQYCTWNCSYGVPQYNPERGVVGKCDMCYGRLALEQAPACASACPESAIRIEIVDVATWRIACDAERQPAGVPAGDGSFSTTRVTVPDALAPNAKPPGLTHVAPAEPHWPLVIMTVLTQLSVGAFATLWLLQVLGAVGLGSAGVTTLFVGAVALAASTLHLGRPIHAYRALKMWRRSWLSREVLLFAGFSAVAALYASVLWFGLPGAPVLGPLTVALGISGVFASACIYRVPSRPAWNTWYTTAQFFLTAAVLGPLFVATLGTGSLRWLGIAAAGLAALKLVLLTVRFLAMTASDRIELCGTARLLSTTLQPHFILRGVLLALGGILLPLLFNRAGMSPGPYDAGFPAAAWAFAAAGEILERYLFFVSVVPTHLAAPYLSLNAEAA
jgi:Fe-S-cluster-containing dehydrogenase component/DMSO reductase anchor subunit